MSACDKPPPGWGCIRPGGHSGPCAAVPLKRTPVYTYSIAYAGGGRHAVTVVDGDRHVVTAFVEVDSGGGDEGAHALGRELVRALTFELALTRGAT